jgi:hypothetical protein
VRVLEGLWIAINSDHSQRIEVGEKKLGVAPQAQCRVNKERSITFQRGGKKLKSALR